jgi:predicted nucleic acid-binding Zn ribbon protein
VTHRPRRRSTERSRRPARYLDGGESRQPEAISDVLGTVFERVTRLDRSAVTLVEEWEQIAGEAWSDAAPVGLANGVLTVEVPSGAAASLLRFQIADLQAAIAARFGPDLVTGVRLRVARRR